MSRQRQDSRRSDARSTSSAAKAQRQRRQGQKPSPAKSAKTPKPSAVQAPSASKQHPATQARRLVSPAPNPTAKATGVTTNKTTGVTAKQTPQRTQKKAPEQRVAASPSAVEPVIEPVIASAVEDVVIAAPLAEMPEVPQTPQTPEIPEVPETTEVPQVPETQEVPEAPEITSVPEPPEKPEIPEPPESPEVPEIPETPEPERPEQPSEPPNPTEPTEPPEPIEPTEPPMRIEPEQPGEVSETAESDAPTAQAADIQPQDGQDDDVTADVMAEGASGPETPDVSAVPVVPIATEETEAAEAAGAPGRRMPTLAVMNRSRRDETGAAEKKAVKKASAEQTEDAEDQDGKSVITRPVAARFSNRRKTSSSPSFVWEGDPRLPYLPWPMRRRMGKSSNSQPTYDLVLPVAVAHIFAMALLGLMGALQGLGASGPLGTWLLVGALIVGLGGVAAYTFREIESLQRFAPGALLLSQLGLLVWAMLIVGPRASLLVLIPALIEVAALMSDTLLASVFALGALLIYALFAGFSISLAVTPVSAPSGAGALVFDVVCVVAGLLAALWLLLAILSGRERALAIARARRHEADVLRNLVTQFRQEVQDDTGKLEAALLQALKGQGIGAMPTEGMYRLLAETIMDTAARLEVLQRDREERLRLEGALRVVVRAVERQWLGVEPEWPEHTGTPIDELVALLRTPRLDVAYQREVGTPSITPRLIPIPTLSVERDTPPPTPISRPLSGSSWMSSRRSGRLTRRPDLYPLPPSAPSPASPGDGATSDKNGSHPGNRRARNTRAGWPAQDDR